MLLRMCLILALFVMMLPADIAFAEDHHHHFTAQYRQNVPVQLDVTSGSEVSTLDPALASDTVSVTVIENLFLGLTDIDPFTGQIRPELAETWDISTDGQTWTFQLRNDVQWLRYDPATAAVEKLRPVVAEDFVYGIKRACDPRLGGYYGTVLAKVIEGCQIVNQSPPDDTNDALVYGESTRVYAPDSRTLVIELRFPASFFFAMTPLWAMRPVPQEIIAAYGDDWTVPGNLVSNGAFFVDELTRGVQRRFVRNQGLPQDLLAGSDSGLNGNVEVIQSSIAEDIGTSFALYQDHRIDTTAIPSAELQALLSSPSYNNQILQVFDLSVFYFGYIHDKPPFDNVHVRRAFSAVINRAAFVESIRSGRGLPMIHFTPPGIAHAPPINEVGVGFNPDYAREQLALGGYPNCEGLREIEIATFTTTGIWGEFWAASAEEYLGCPANLFNIEQLEFSVLLEIIAIGASPNDTPNAWSLGWSPNYPDANNFVNDVLSCTAENRFRRPCSEVDKLIEEAARTPDFNRRTELYAEIEAAFFGEAGEFPMAPLFVRSDFILVKPWYSGPFEIDGIFSGTHWDAQSIDMAAKLAAQENR